MSNLFLYSVLALVLPFLACASSEHYWREYTGGEIPKDAIIGGEKDNGENVYIGQVYAESKKLMVTEIRPKQKGVIALRTQMITVMERNIKILCGLQENFFWVLDNETNVEGNESTVFGGHVNDRVVLIGRVFHNGSVHIGSIFNSRLHWVDRSKAESEAAYEVLSYEAKVPQVQKRMEGYYWREYNGTVPKDAIIGGKDINRKNLFMGQADTGSDLSVVRIFPGVTEVEASHTGNKITRYIKILCGHAFWKPVTVDLHLMLVRYEAVLAGHKKDGGYLAIGRVSYENEVKIGQIPFHSYLNSLLYFSDRGYVKLASSYEILVAKIYNFNKTKE